jgi:PAS domain S-box-containing protein
MASQDSDFGNCALLRTCTHKFVSRRQRRAADIFANSNPWNFAFSCGRIDHRRAKISRRSAAERPIALPPELHRPTRASGYSVRRPKEAWLHTVSQTIAWRYAIALVAFLASFFVRDLLNNWLIGISDRGLIIFLPAILLVAFFLGLGPAILAALLSALAIWYVFLPPYAHGIDSAVVLAGFVAGSGVSIALVYCLRTTITAAKVLEQAQTDYLSMLDAGFDAIILRDAQDRITGWNRGAESLHGWRREEVLSRAVHSLLQTEFPKTLDEINADMRRSGRWEGELIHTRKDGKRIIVFSRWTPKWDAKKEQPVSVLQINTDITDRKQADALITADLCDPANG